MFAAIFFISSTQSVAAVRENDAILSHFLENARQLIKRTPILTALDLQYFIFYLNRP